MTKVTRLTLDQEGGLQNRRIHLREISGDIDAPLETVGQDLRAARLRRGDDLATVSRALKIRKDHLEALEEDRLDALPGRTYAIGFVRSYADYLGLDAVQSVERFKAEIAGRSDHTTPQVQVIDEDEHRRLPQGWKIIAGVVIVLLIYGAYHLIVSADQMLSQPTTPPPPQATAKPVVAAKPVTPHVAAAPTTTIGNTTTPGGSAQAVPPSGATPQAGQTSLPGVTPAPGTTTATASPPTPPTNGLMPSGDNAAAATQPAPLASGQVYGGQNRTARVILRVHEATRILVQGADGRVFINRALKAGDSYQVPNLVGLTLTTPNAGAVELELDNASMGFAGHSQEVKDGISLDPQAIVDRYNGGRG
jgi:cytoskeleton protein RodZ